MATATSTAKLDLYKEHATEYAATRKPAIVDIPLARYLTIEGKGKPGGEAFQSCVGALYTIAFTIKMTSKFFGGHDYAVCKLEGLYWTSGDCSADFASAPPEEWEWKLMIRTPEFIDGRDLKAAVAKALEKGKSDAFRLINIENMREGQCVQALHVGPYSAEPVTIEEMRREAERHGYKFHGAHHEIYLSDPRRVPSERIKTILRIPVKLT